MNRVKPNNFQETAMTGIYDFSVTTLDGRDISLAD